MIFVMWRDRRRAQVPNYYTGQAGLPFFPPADSCHRLAHRSISASGFLLLFLYYIFTSQGCKALHTPHGRASPNFFVPVACGRDSILLWRRCDICHVIPIFLDDVIFSRSDGLYGASCVFVNGESETVKTLLNSSSRISSVVYSQRLHCVVSRIVFRWHLGCSYRRVSVTMQYNLVPAKWLGR